MHLLFLLILTFSCTSRKEFSYEKELKKREVQLAKEIDISKYRRVRRDNKVYYIEKTLFLKDQGRINLDDYKYHERRNGIRVLHPRSK